jgi:hypothetical protein
MRASLTIEQAFFPTKQAAPDNQPRTPHQDGFFPSRVRNQIATEIPSAKPTSTKKLVPIFRSSHCPSSPGNTIASEITNTRDTHSMATAIPLCLAAKSDGSLTENAAFDP